MRQGEPCELLLRSFELSAEAGADILSIESVGGKEVHDKALVVADTPSANAIAGMSAIDQRLVVHLLAADRFDRQDVGAALSAELERTE